MIFISYRRSEAADVTGRIYDRLKARFGAAVVFKDVLSIPPGVDFRDHLKDQLATTEVLVAVIGAAWIQDARLSDPGDYVRLEIEWAIRARIPIVPVLVGGAKMPVPAELPESLGALAFQQALVVRADPDFDGDCDRLLRGLERHLSRGAPPRSEDRSPNTPAGSVPDTRRKRQFDPDVFAVYRSHFASADDLPLVHAINDETFRSTMLVPRATLETWWRSNPWTIRIVRTPRGEAVGYWHVLPLTDRAFRGILDLSVAERDIGPDDVLAYGQLRESSVNLYITAVAARPTMQRSSASVILDLFAFLDLLHTTKGIAAIGALAVSDDPLQLISRFQMKQVASRDGVSTWMLDSGESIDRALAEGSTYRKRLAGFLPEPAPEEERVVRDLVGR